MTDEIGGTAVTEPDSTAPTPDPARRVRKIRHRRYRKSDPRYRPEHDFRWRAKIRANPQSHFMYRWVVFVVGLVIVAAGLVMVPLPGPGWLVVILGLLIWSSEFDRAQWLLDFVRTHVRAWNRWIMRQHWFVRALVATATFLFVCAIVWTTFKLTGMVKHVPEPYQSWVRENLRL